MAREAGWWTISRLLKVRLERFEALVRADEREQGQKWFDAVTAQHRVMILAEREACAKLVEPSEEHRRDASWGYIGGEEGVSMLDDLAAEIRARGETK
jgi:hypothetical protein